MIRSKLDYKNRMTKNVFNMTHDNEHFEFDRTYEKLISI